MPAPPPPGGRRAYRVAALVLGLVALTAAVAMFGGPPREPPRRASAEPTRVVPPAPRAPTAPDPDAPALPIAGWVIDGAGLPIAGVEVTFVDAAGLVGGAAETDADGAFRLAPPSPGLLRLDAAHVFPAQVRWQGHGPAPRILLSRRISIDARVTADGAPAEGVLVHVSDGSSPTLATALTGADGVARFDDLQAGPYELWAERDRMVTPLVRTVHDGAEPVATVELALGPGGAVHGGVAPDGVPAETVVRLIPVDVDHAVRIAELDDRGRFAIDGVPRGRWRVEAEAPGWFQDGERTVDVGGAPEEVEVQLERAGVVSGTVVDATGAPVANATLVLRGSGPRPRSLILSEAAERPSRRMRWVHPLAGKRLLPWRDFGRFGAPREGVRPAECGRGHCGIDLGGTRGAIVHAAADGVVSLVFHEIRKEAGRYVAIDHPGGLRTFYMHLDEIRPDLEIGQAVRGGEPIGTVGRTGVIKDAPHLHFAIAQERGIRRWYVDPEPILQHAVVLPAPRQLAGAGLGGAPTLIATVQDDAIDAPVPAPAAAARAVTDALGRFRIEGVSPGDFVAVAYHDDLAPGVSDPFEVHAGAERDGVVIELSPGVIVFGRVAGRHGAIPGARVAADEGTSGMGQQVAAAFTDARGDFVLRALDGPITLTVTAGGHGEVSRVVTLDGRRTPGAWHREDFDLVVEDGRLSGEVLDPQGHAAALVEVRIVDGPSRRRRAVTDPRGHFVIDGVAPGRYEIELVAPEHPRLRATLETDRHAELRLAQGAALEIALRDAHTAAPLAGIRVDADGPGDRITTAVTDAQGLATLSGLAPGTWTLSARAGGYVAARQRVELAPSRVPREIAFELARGATLAGVVRDRYGRRVAAATVTAGGVTTRTDGDGEFRLADVPTGAVEVIAESGAARGAITLELAPGDEHLSLKIDVVE